MTTEAKAAATQIAEEDLREIIRDEMTEGKSHRFRWDGTVNLGHVLTALAMTATLAAGWLAFDKRLSLVEVAVSRQTDVLERSIRLDERFQAVIQRLDRLERPK